MTDFDYHIMQHFIFLAVALSVAPTLQALLFKARDNEALKWLNVWYLYQGAFTVVHIVLAYAFKGNNDSVVPISYLIGQSVDPIIAIFAVYPALVKNIKRWVIHTAIISYALAMWYLAITLGDAYSSGLFGRPQEFAQIVPALICMLAFSFAPSVYGRLMFFGIFTTFIGGMFMLNSRELFDGHFDLAHWFQTASVLWMNVVVMYLYCNNRAFDRKLCKPLLTISKKIKVSAGEIGRLRKLR